MLLIVKVELRESSFRELCSGYEGEIAFYMCAVSV